MHHNRRHTYIKITTSRITIVYLLYKRVEENEKLLKLGSYEYLQEKFVFTDCNLMNCSGYNRMLWFCLLSIVMLHSNLVLMRKVTRV